MRIYSLSKICFVISLLSQILEPIYSDRNFLALGLARLHILDGTPRYLGSMSFSDMYDFLFYNIHVSFGDLGLLLTQIILMLIVSGLLYLNLKSVNGTQSPFLFLIYLMALISIFYARDISPAHFSISIVLLLMLLAKGRRVKLSILNIFLIFSLPSQRIYFDIATTPLGEDIYNAIYSLSVAFLLLVLSMLLLKMNKKRILQIFILSLLCAASFYSPFLRMVFPIYVVIFIGAYLGESQGLVNISSILSRFVSSLSFLSGYALIFFLLAFSFTQAGPCFKVPLHSTFMPAERIDKIIQEGKCLGSETGFSEEERSRFSGYLMYRRVYSGLRFCDS